MYLVNTDYVAIWDKSIPDLPSTVQWWNITRAQGYTLDRTASHGPPNHVKMAPQSVRASHPAGTGDLIVD